MRRKTRAPKAASAAAIVLSAGLFVGCGSTHYRVTDPSTGKEYYTTKVRDRDGGVRFIETETARKVTLDDAEVEEISKQEFQRVTRPN